MLEQLPLFVARTELVALIFNWNPSKSDPPQLPQRVKLQTELTFSQQEQHFLLVANAEYFLKENPL